MITLRPHQVGAIQHIDKALSQVYKAILCVLPTGAGKSLTLAEYARRAYHNKEVRRRMVKRIRGFIGQLTRIFR